MKFILFSCFLLVLLAVANTEQHHNKHQKSHKNKAHPVHTKTKVVGQKSPSNKVHPVHTKTKVVSHITPSIQNHEENDNHWSARARKADKQGHCQLVCDGNIQEPPGKNVTKYADGSWSYDVQVDANGFIHIGYNRTSDFLAIFNPHLNFTWMTDGVFIGLFNITSGALFLIDTTKNIASVFTNIAFGALDVQLGIMGLFAGQFDLLIRNSFNMVGNFAFRVDNFLKSLREHTLDAFFRGHLNIFNALDFNFGIYINGSLKFDGFNVFLGPIIGTGKFAHEIINSIGGSIEYGRKLTFGTVGFIFTGLGRITAQITLALKAVVEGSVNSFLNFGTGSINAIFNAGGSLFNVITGSVHVSGSGGFHVSTGISVNSGFQITYGNETGNYSIDYNATRNTLGVYNDNLKFAQVADGTFGMFILLNTTSGVGLIVNATGYGNVVIDQVNDTGHLDMGSRFALLAKLLTDNAGNMSGSLSFNFTTYLNEYYNGGVANDTNIDSDLAAILDENFGDFLAYAEEHNGAALFSNHGVSSMFNIMFGDNVIGLNFAALLNSIYEYSQGKFSPKLMKQVYAKVQINIKAGNRGFSKYIFSGLVKACVRGGFGINGILGSVGFGRC